MNLSLLLLVLLCLAVAAYTAYRVSTLQQELAIVKSTAESAVTLDELDGALLPWLDKMQAEQVALRRSVAVLASAAQTTGGATTLPEAEDAGDEEEDDDEDEDAAVEGDEPPQGERMQSLLSSVATVVLGSFGPPTTTSSSRSNNATRVLIHRPLPPRPAVIEEAEEDVELTDGEVTEE
jgi:hypothetical protein